MTSIETKKIDFQKAAAILKSISHPVRLKIISLLVGEELSVNEMVKYCHSGQPVISHHLSQMRLRGLLKTRRDGKQIYYSLKEEGLISVLDCIADCNCNL